MGDCAARADRCLNPFRGGFIVMRKALLIIGFAGLACGSQETSTSPDLGEGEATTPAVSAVAPPSEVTTPEAAAGPAAGTGTSEVSNCVGLAEEGKYDEALVACQAAASLYPNNNEVAAALAKVGSAMLNAESAAGADSAAAAGAAGEAAKE
jgi:hypothetical protein